MRLKHHQLSRTFALAVAMIATTVALAFGAEVGLAADYQDKNHNVCEGPFRPRAAPRGGPTSKAKTTSRWATR
jgi:phosphate-selective porin